MLEMFFLNNCKKVVTSDSPKIHQNSFCHTGRNPTFFPTPFTANAMLNDLNIWVSSVAARITFELFQILLRLKKIVIEL